MTARSGGGRVRQRLTAGVGAVVLVVVVLALNFYQLPVVALFPGPAEDVLSRVKVEGGTQVYDSKGRFYLTSVGIDDDVRFFEAILDLANRDVQLRPRSDIYPQGESTQQVNQQNADDMDESKVLAAVVALRKLGYTVDPSAVDVTEVRPGAPADGKPRIGVVLHEQYGKLPVPVSINTENIGGPSAGLMFALSIYDRLTPGDLTGGRRIAGTGQIVEDGSVVPIGGVAEKLVAARRQGATVFLVPRGNCDEADRHPPPGLLLVPVSSVRDAVAFLESRSGRPPSRC